MDEDALTTSAIVSSEGFLSAHPDLRWRKAGMEAYESGKFEYAFTCFGRAARYADKPSQAMLADMLWTGTNVPQDRPRAYAWMDLAAERDYGDFVRLREAYWAQLTESERKQAIEVGTPMLAEFGDEAAKPRLQTLLVRARKNLTGSRVGTVGPMRIELPGPGGVPMTVSGQEYYDDRYWVPEQYWEWQDYAWRKPRDTEVKIGDFEAVADPASSEPDQQNR